MGRNTPPPFLGFYWELFEIWYSVNVVGCCNKSNVSKRLTMNKISANKFSGLIIRRKVGKPVIFPSGFVRNYSQNLAIKMFVWKWAYTEGISHTAFASQRYLTLSVWTTVQNTANTALPSCFWSYPGKKYSSLSLRTVVNRGESEQSDWEC